MRAAIFHFSLLMLCTQLWAVDDYREFTDKSNRVIRAKPVNVVGKQVRIQREDGQEFNVDTSMFVSADQAFLNEWVLVYLANNNRLFKVTTKETGTKKIKSDGVGITYYNWDGFYKLNIENQSDLILHDLRVEYRFYVFDDQMGGQKKSDGELDKNAGSIPIKMLGPRNTAELETVKTKMMDSKLDGGWYFASGGDRKSKDKMEGIHLKIFKGDLELVDYCEPSSLREKYKW